MTKCYRKTLRTFSWIAIAAACCTVQLLAAERQVPHELRGWLEPQTWIRDCDQPVVQLGKPSQFDDMHLFAPYVVQDGNQFRMFYCGSRGKVEDRVFALGLATSRDGKTFEKFAGNPVYRFGDEKHSILTPSILRDGDQWRMWFAATDFKDASGLHTLHAATSADGVHWSEPSPALLTNVYAPSVIKTGRTYRMWFTRVGQKPWVICHATSQNGREWKVTPQPVLELDQPWEHERLFYTAVVRHEGAYLMWYGSYWKEAQPELKTALGLAVSLDGIQWYKHPANPVFRPDVTRSWESNYVTSHSVMRLSDGQWRIWYATRTNPPLTHKYFAIGTASWSGPAETAAKKESSAFVALNPDKPPTEFREDQERWREWLRDQLGIPRRRVSLDAEHRGDISLGDITIEKWVFTSEPGSRIPALLYRPKVIREPSPAIVLTYGHGGSKNTWEHQYAGQLYAKLGVVCLAMDSLGEEERNVRGGMGTRAHDDAQADAKAAQDRGRAMDLWCLSFKRDGSAYACYIESPPFAMDMVYPNPVKATTPKGAFELAELYKSVAIRLKRRGDEKKDVTVHVYHTGQDGAAGQFLKDVELFEEIFHRTVAASKKGRLKLKRLFAERWKR